MRSRLTRAVLTGEYAFPTRCLAYGFELTFVLRHAATRTLQSGPASQFRPGRAGVFLAVFAASSLSRRLRSLCISSDALAPVLYAQAKADPDAIFQNPSKTCRCVLGVSAGVCVAIPTRR
jgi:hypothetical protein